MRLGGHVWIHAHGDGRDFFQPRRDFVDAHQFWLALRVEAKNILPQGEFNLRLRLGRPGENAFARVSARLDDAPQFTSAHDVKAAATIRQRAQH